MKVELNLDGTQAETTVELVSNSLSMLKTIKPEDTKKLILEAFEKSKTKTVSDVCRLAGIARITFYRHLNKDAEFRQKILSLQF